MKITDVDIMRKLADLVSSSQGANSGDQPTGAQSGSPELGPMYDEDGNQLVKQPTNKSVPPLQLKLELLKKAVGVENLYAEGNQDVDPEASNYKTTPMSEDEATALESMKKAAGINALIRNEMSDDEPLDS